MGYSASAMVLVQKCFTTRCLQKGHHLSMFVASCYFVQQMFNDLRVKLGDLCGLKHRVMLAAFVASPPFDKLLPIPSFVFARRVPTDQLLPIPGPLRSHSPILNDNTYKRCTQCETSMVLNYRNGLSNGTSKNSG